MKKDAVGFVPKWLEGMQLVCGLAVDRWSAAGGLVPEGALHGRTQMLSIHERECVAEAEFRLRSSSVKKIFSDLQMNYRTQSCI